MKSKIFTVFLNFVCVICLLSVLEVYVFAYSGDCSASSSDSVSWSIDTYKKVLTISGTGKMESYLENSAPWYSYRYLFKSVIIEDGVTNVGWYAFYDCDNLISIEIPNSVTIICRNAFEACSNLENMKIPSSVTCIDYKAFYGCTKLKSVIFADDSHLTRIEESAFSSCINLTSMEIPDGVTYIGKSAFFNSQSLTNVTFGENSQLISIGNVAFSDCSSLSSIKIPDSVISIGSQAFRVCSSLESIEIPNSVTSIGSYAFSGCSKLSTVYYTGTQEQWNKISIGSSNDPLFNAEMVFFGKEICFEIPKLPAEVESATVLLATYDENGVFTGFIEKTVSATDTETTFTVDTRTGETYKIFVFDVFGKLMPLCENVQGDIKKCFDTLLETGCVFAFSASK